MSQYTVQVFVDQNSFLIGHVAVKLTDISGNSTAVGFYPEDNVTHSLSDALNGFLGYGDVRDDTKRLSDMEGKSAVIEITKAQYDAMTDYANQVRTDSTSTYFLGGDGLGLNCATFARNLLDAGNVPHPDIEVHPYECLPYSVVEQRVLDGLMDFGKWLGEFFKPLDNAIADLFTSAQKFFLRFDPLTLDLDGDGLETGLRRLSAGVAR